MIKKAVLLRTSVFLIKTVISCTCGEPSLISQERNKLNLTRRSSIETNLMGKKIYGHQIKFDFETNDVSVEPLASYFNFNELQALSCDEDKWKILDEVSRIELVKITPELGVVKNVSNETVIFYDGDTLKLSEYTQAETKSSYNFIYQIESYYKEEERDTVPFLFEAKAYFSDGKVLSATSDTIRYETYWYD